MINFLDDTSLLTSEQKKAIVEFLSNDDEVYVWTTQDASLCFYDSKREDSKSILKVGILPKKYNTFVSDNVVRDASNLDLDAIIK